MPFIQKNEVLAETKYLAENKNLQRKMGGGEACLRNFKTICPESRKKEQARVNGSR